ncbi:MAG: hypothetical protein HY975_01760 [Candidatus Kerfeldbacteria bacterium]|nr:hypothetical protein [Candidatus Kerfeldbacteria bacterium]
MLSPETYSPGYLDTSDSPSADPVEDPASTTVESPIETEGRTEEVEGEQPAEVRGESAEPRTVRELLDLWRQEYEVAEGEEKQEVAYRIIKMGEAMSAAHLDPSEVTIKPGEAGVAGFYDNSTGEVAITPEGIGLPADHYTGVLVHEATHAGVITGRKIMDEGLTEIVTQRTSTIGGEGIYHDERSQARETFGQVSLDSAIDAYDFKHPEELLNLYFKTEWKKGFESELHSLITPELVLHPELRQSFIDGPAKEWVTKTETALRQAAPRLVGEAEQQGFNFAATHLRYVNDFIERA